MKPPAIATWPPPSSSIRKGTSTPAAPNINEGMETNAVAVRIGRVTIVAATSRIGCCSGGPVPAGGPPSPPTAPRCRIPRRTRLGPDFGCDRSQDRADQGARHRGAERRSDHRAAPLRRGGRDQPGQRPGPDQRPRDPLGEARRSSRTISSARPKTRLEPPSSSSPPITVRRGPTQVATSPAGSEASSVPAA